MSLQARGQGLLKACTAHVTQTRITFVLGVILGLLIIEYFLDLTVQHKNIHATGTTSMFSFSLRHIVPSTEIPTRHCPVLLNEPHCDQPRNLSNDLGWNPFLPIMHPKFDQLDTGGTALQLLYKDKGSKTAQPLNVSWESCAVVSSSEVLLKSGFGRQIDEHSAVIRFNEAPAGGRFARDVGSRTTIRLQNGQRCGFSDSKPAEYCLGFTGAGVHCQNKCMALEVVHEGITTSKRKLG
ncbi:hypothetical protein CYMTET_30585 [Cymbomonas tetramitiformis]|uniref:beta-galactoside alpha-(2,6)-sialyltransferase n=1 Tax=Cymbomonas tetramitiformis TaxID=36881 RepID=A0AAE0FIJ6_9CHLO|nr:hypothetical protein CYMTET_30585 [Cymbomonas tetramitiformis]